MAWIFIIIAAYFFFALSSFSDKLFLSSTPNPKVYAFFIGLFGVFSIAFVPFVDFGLPQISSWFAIVAEAIVFIAAIYFLYVAVRHFEVSKVVPAVGSIQPIIIFFFSWIFFGFQEITLLHALAFVILIIGTALISFQTPKDFNWRYVALLFLSASFFSLDFIFSKIVFSAEPFWQGLIWMRIVSAAIALLFIVDKSVRHDIFASRENNTLLSQKAFAAIILAMGAGTAAGLLQSFAISIVPISHLAVMNSLRGMQYVFLFTIVLFFSFFFPNILKERLSRGVVLRRIISIAIIFSGLALLFIQ